MAKQLTENTDEKEQKKAQRIDSPVSQRLLSLKQAAKYLGRGEDSMRELIYARVFPVIQEGARSKIWLDINDLNSWIKDRKRRWSPKFGQYVKL